MSTVILAEKPSQALAYVEAFQSNSKKDGYYEVSDPVLPAATVVTFGFGHLVELAAPAQYDSRYEKWELADLPIFPNPYQFNVAKDKQKQFKIVQRLLKAADTIIVATDSDREGENIAWSIMVKAGLNLKAKSIKRLWINSLEPQAILKGFRQLKDGWAYYPFYQEAQTRQISDWLVGMNASRLYGLLLRQNGVNGKYSIGRVQTPTLYMVYERDLAIQNFKPVPYFELQAQIMTPNGVFEARLDPYQRFKEPAELTAFQQAKQVVTGKQDAVIKDVQQQAKQSASPRLFSLSSLQSTINKRYHASASKTLAAVQKLYEAKLLTYPRTDCNYITQGEFEYLVTKLPEFKSLVLNCPELPQLTPQSRHVNDKRVQEHHAIIMTEQVPTAAKLKQLSVLEQQVYDLVLRTTLAMFAAPYEYDETTIISSVGQADFKATGKVPTQQGWQALFTTRIGTDDSKAKTLPAVTIGQPVQAEITTPQKKTTPPASFTEGTLITAMKTAGKTLDDEQAQTTLKAVEGIGTEATRANILEGLKQRGYLVIKKNQVHVSEVGVTLCQAVALEPLLTSPEMTAQWEMALKEIGQQQREPASFIAQIQKFVQKLLAEFPTQFNTDVTLKQQLQQHQQVQEQAKKAATLGRCPACRTGEIIAHDKFYGCTNYRAKTPCKFTLPKKFASKTLGVTAIKDLITVGETKKLKGFKSKKGKPFEARIKLIDGKLEFDFDKSR
ncbi:type IA DNA topoisomerase [Lactiplantibacillus plantarum]|uniref:type IA DNA topoisomerase n=1 Tax=Lactiplantibacillus plantarum TaxID=1590 RepID=UPI001BABADB0|nr:type IA DNA topoisomerase [Lactiplantibacillus plantarum]MBS0935713.1 DNA topoisomerase 3 [Lactiplantibacillus plantarum]MBS0943930.1 DNA topoisomerase 3 [Lactiplantibacillus plantarum]